MQLYSRLATSSAGNPNSVDAFATLTSEYARRSKAKVLSRVLSAIASTMGCKLADHFGRVRAVHTPCEISKVEYTDTAQC